MTCRERVLRAIRFEYPDRIPITYAAVAPARLQHGQALAELCRRYPNDFYDTSRMEIPARDEEIT